MVLIVRPMFPDLVIARANTATSMSANVIIEALIRNPRKVPARRWVHEAPLFA
jgi:hypothetical protein